LTQIGQQAVDQFQEGILTRIPWGHNLMCRDKNNIEVEFAIRDINKPIGVSEFQFAKILPDELKPNLPTIE